MSRPFGLDKLRNKLILADVYFLLILLALYNADFTLLNNINLTGRVLILPLLNAALRQFR